MAFNQFDPIRGYKAGKEVAKDSGILDAFGASEEERKFQRQLQLETHKASLKGGAKSEDVGVYSFSPHDNKIKEVARIKKGSIVRNEQPSLDERTQAALAKKEATGAGAESGKIALAKEAIGSIRDVKSILFPSGTPESFRRSIAAESNIFGGLSEEAQNVFRKAGNSLAARQLISTGVAARPEETEALQKRFIANIKSNPRAAYQALEELEGFYNEYLGVSDPSGMFHQKGSEIEQSGTSGQPPVKDDLEARKEMLRKRYQGL